MKKLTVISILVILALGQCGYYCFYAFQLHTAKKEAKHKLLKSIPEKLLTTFQADDNRIRWEDEGKEICVNGKMYDVVKIQQAGKNKLVFCISDEKEDAVLEQLSTLIKSGIDAAGNGHEKKQAPVRLPVKDWFFETTGINGFDLEGVLTAAKKEFADYNSALPEIFTEIKSPPPNTNI